jgi:hypothetical protein
MAIFIHYKKKSLVKFASPISPSLSGNILPIIKKRLVAAVEALMKGQGKLTPPVGSW